VATVDSLTRRAGTVVLANLKIVDHLSRFIIIYLIRSNRVDVYNSNKNGTHKARRALLVSLSPCGD